MTTTRDPEKLSLAADEEPSGDSLLHIDGVLAGYETPDEAPEAVAKSRISRWVRIVWILLTLKVAIAVMDGVVLAVLRRNASPGEPERPFDDTWTTEPSLHLPALYADVASPPPGSACHATWHALDSLPCHEWFVDRDRAGHGRTASDPWDLVLHPETCSDACASALQFAFDNLTASCTPQDRFDSDRTRRGSLEGAPDTLDGGPISVVGRLLRKEAHFCRWIHGRDGRSSQICAIEMSAHFGGIFGMDAGLEQLERFIERTSDHRIEAFHWLEHTHDIGDRSRTVRWPIRDQHYSPEACQTTCDVCVFDFLNRTLNSWAEGTRDPKTGAPLSLVAFMRRVKMAGERCDHEQSWQRIYHEAIGQYMEAGLLQPSDLSKLRQPVHDLDSLVRNGVWGEDELLAGIRRKLKASTPTVVGAIVPAGTVCLKGLSRHYSSLPCYINLSEEQYEYMLNEPRSNSNSIRSAFCRHECSDALGTTDRRRKAPDCVHQTTPEGAREEVAQYNMAVQRREHFCRLTTPVFASDNCAKALVDMHKTEWATRWLTPGANAGWTSFKPMPLVEISKELDKLEDRAAVLAPEQRNLGAIRAQKPVTGHDRDSAAPWKEQLGASICAGCFWQWLVGTSENEIVMRSSWKGAPRQSRPHDYFAYMKKFHRTCTALGADWLGGTPYGDDPVIWRVKEPNGDVVRYLAHTSIEGSQPGDIYSVRESDGRLRREPTLNSEQVTLWHVLRWERSIEAFRAGRGAEWRQQEEAHRAEADQALLKTLREEAAHWVNAGDQAAE